MKRIYMIKERIKSSDNIKMAYAKLTTILNQIKVYNKPKIFGIGRNKTGTSSLTSAMHELGYVVGYQKEAELLFSDWVKRDFRKLIKFCHTAQFFQDIPFSLPYTYIIMDHTFKRSKFILTVRDTPDQWYNSITKFHTKIYGKNGQIPTKEDLQNAFYRYSGMPYDINKYVYNTPENDLYNKDILIKHYNYYNQGILDYFKHRPDDLLVLNVAEEDAYRKLTIFLGKTIINKNFPWKNKT